MSPIQLQVKKPQHVWRMPTSFGMTSRFEKNTPIRQKKNQDLLMKQTNKKRSPRSPKPKSWDEKFKTHALIALHFKLSCKSTSSSPCQPAWEARWVSCHPDLPARLLVIKNNQNFMMKTILLISGSRGNGWVKTFFFHSYMSRGAKGWVHFHRQIHQIAMSTISTAHFSQRVQKKGKSQRGTTNRNLSRS